MPIYEYRCDACGEQMEKLQRMSDDRLVDCPACGKPALKRLVSAVAFRLKGGGWYETDFKKQNQRNLADSHASNVSGSSSSASSSSNSSSSGDSSGASSASSESKSSTGSSSADTGGKKVDSKSAAKPSTQSSSD